ncbi:uroporphyrinogen-III synthase [Marilutibacter spongiae]|uniref:Uroporphyrinogen-III synthase n=1 Tax=Marilutibacter spongiae TaxID=2025720 RepID=A0A7W3TNT7_9GAMM|nr:uroporphyrinogen-III synthase [Lysobacter spongiae]MBB1061737.1 uroporphyrinogen-III synthase [Lysobacter spongiae]
MQTPLFPRWHLISLRPQGRHDALRAAARRHGGGVLALSTCRLEPIDDARTRAGLAAALATGLAIFTSPAAVAAANALQALDEVAGLHAVAVGEGTAAALRRLGTARTSQPTRMDSEGLLGLPVLQHVDGRKIGLVTAPGGRGLLQPQLEARGAKVLRADVYRRRPVAPSPRALAALARLRPPAVVALTSGEALAQAFAQVPDDQAARLRALPAVASSARLADKAREAGFGTVGVAAGPRPASLVEAALALLGEYPGA